MVSAAWAFGFGLLAFEGLLDCSGNEDQPQGAGAVSGGGPNGGASSGGVSGTAAGGSPASSAAGSGGDLSELDAPDEAQALLSFLEAKQYAGWAKEGESHPSEGPHGDGVRVYYSPKAAQALRSGAATFPAGAASVKELTSSGALYGYSVWVKVQDASDGGKGFYWYELIHNAGGRDTVSGNARGSSACVGCHSAGNDYSRSTLPFE